MYTGMSQLELYAMGMAVIDNDQNVSLHSSDNPYTHISEAENMDEIVNNYLSSEEGINLINYLGAKSKSKIDIKGYGSGDLGEGVIAAVLHDGIEGVILSNYDGKPFSERISDMANQYDLSADAALEYVLAHEFAHAHGYKSETETENVIKEYFQDIASNSEGEIQDKYESLARVAEERCSEASYSN
jgi:hypothetical protein